MKKPRLVRITTVPMSLKYLLGGQLAFMKSRGFDVIAISADGNERDEIRKEIVDHIVIPFTRQITPFRDAVCLIKLVALFLKLKPEIVHTHTPKAGLLGMLAAWLCRVPVRLHTVAGLPLVEANGIMKRVLRLTERTTYACADKVYPNSKGLLEVMVREFPRFRSKFQVIGRGSSNGIDAQYFCRTATLTESADAIRKERGILREAIVFSFAGRVVKDKGMKELVQAFARVADEKKNIYLLLVGPLEQNLDPLDKNDLAFLKDHERVVMTGFQADVRPWLLASDVFVFPSYREGFPNVVLQAACLELPCIVSDINGCNEIIMNENTGLTVPPKDAAALYHAMVRLAGDAPLRSRLGKKSRLFVAEYFDQQYVWEEVLKEYRKMLMTKVPYLLQP